MKEKLKNLPPPLRKQVLLRFAGAGACFCLLLLVAVGYCQPMLWFPFLVVGAFSAGSGALLMWRVDQVKVLVVEGVCREVESTLFRLSLIHISVSVSHHRQRDDERHL